MGDRLTTRGRKSAEIVRLALAGISRDAIAAKVGTTLGAISVVLSNARRRGLSIPKKSGGQKPWRRQQIVDLVARGLSPEKMSEALGISRNNVGVQLAVLRSAGVDVPYRRVPSPALRAAIAARPPRRESDWETKLTEKWSRRHAARHRAELSP